MLINKDAKPADSVYYIACCIIEELKKRKWMIIDEGFQIIKGNYNKSLKYTDYLLALHFLYLIERIILKEGGLYFVH
jgi:hypothetical protein